MIQFLNHLPVYFCNSVVQWFSGSVCSQPLQVVQIIPLPNSKTISFSKYSVPIASPLPSALENILPFLSVDSLTVDIFYDWSHRVSHLHICFFCLAPCSMAHLYWHKRICSSFLVLCTCSSIVLPQCIFFIHSFISQIFKFNSTFSYNEQQYRERSCSSNFLNISFQGSWVSSL